MGEHTPGPWAYRPQEYDDWGIVRIEGVDEDGFQRVICQANYVASPEELIAHRTNKTDPAEANARLIAAAPELLEALEDVLRFHDGRGEYNFSGLSSEERANASFDAWQGVLVGIKGAIAKATGNA